MVGAQRRFPAMGTSCHMVVAGHDVEVLADRAQARVEELEHRWSRFLHHSDVSRLNRAAGKPLEVSPDTTKLVMYAIAAWRRTGGRFDPTMGRQIADLGYDRSYQSLSPSLQGVSLRMRAAVGCADIEVRPEANVVRLPTGVSFDAGGIGKGFAADIVTDELTMAGATGVLVNLGGDIRVRGRPHDDDAWTIAIREPSIAGAPIATVRIAEGALATSTTKKRTWMSGPNQLHHALDVTTGLPHSDGAVLTSVIAGEAWWAEAAATALLGTNALVLECPSLLRNADGTTQRLQNFERYEQ